MTFSLLYAGYPLFSGPRIIKTACLVFLHFLLNCSEFSTTTTSELKLAKERDILFKKTFNINRVESITRSERFVIKKTFKDGVVHK